MFYSYEKASFLGLIERGNEKEVTALLERGEVTRDEMDRALQLAMLHGHRTIARRLLERGADPFHGDDEDRQALGYAAIGGDAELVSLCFSLGADPNRVDQRNVTPQALAAGWGWTEAVKKLCAAGADPEIAPSYGGTALIEASPDLLVYLVSNQASKRWESKTPPGFGYSLAAAKLQLPPLPPGFLPVAHIPLHLGPSIETRSKASDKRCGSAPVPHRSDTRTPDDALDQLG